MSRTKEEHLQWCKERAIAACNNTETPQDAIGSLLSDLEKHPETADHPAINPTMQLVLMGYFDNADADKVRGHIDKIFSFGTVTRAKT